MARADQKSRIAKHLLASYSPLQGCYLRNAVKRRRRFSVRTATRKFRKTGFFREPGRLAEKPVFRRVSAWVMPSGDDSWCGLDTTQMRCLLKCRQLTTRVGAL